jgi:hypothetical protein
MDHRHPRGRKPSDRRGWYTLSVDTLRGFVVLVVLAAAAGAGFWMWRDWQAHSEQRRAAALIEEAQTLVVRLQSATGLAAHREELESGRGYLQEARKAYGQGDFPAARRAGQQARYVLMAVLDTLARRGDSGDANFISVQGEVEYRRGETGEWETARSRVALASGDYVRTGAGGSAEIMFGDGTLYTVRPNTSFIVSRRQGGGGGDRSITMEYGWVNLNTASRGARVGTPTADAEVEEDSEAFVSYRRDTREGRFGAYRGSLEVAGEAGRRKIGELEEVVQLDGELSEPRPLPRRPEPVEPADNLLLDSDKVRELVLAWRPVEGASRYALQVSRNQLFVDNLIEDADRAKTQATLGLRGDGSFLWRVAAIGRDGSRGPWSSARKFRVASVRHQSGDDEPPAIELEEVSSYGNIFIVGGRTEPGATVEIDGEMVKVGADGSFTKTIQLNKEGSSYIEIRARDAWGNETVRRRRVFVQVP